VHLVSGNVVDMSEVIVFDAGEEPYLNWSQITRRAGS
jgi:hypothetical protein